MVHSSCSSEGTDRSSCSTEETDRSSCTTEETDQSSGKSDIVMLNDQEIRVKTPVAKNINICNSQRLVIGPNVITITQNVEKINVVKDLSFHRYIWDVVKNTSKKEKATFCGALFVLIICTILIIYFSVFHKRDDNSTNLEPDDWFITRERWLAIPYNDTQTISNSLRLVVVAHTAGPPCSMFIDCAMTVKNIQNYYVYTMGYNIPYSFLIGGDGRVYEGRGWNIQGAHTLGYNNCSVGIAFIGDYREGLPTYTTVTELQQQRAHMLFKEGIKNNNLHHHFHVLGAKDLRPTESPGTNLYNAIKEWPNYDHQNMYKGKTCNEIKELFEDQNTA